MVNQARIVVRPEMVYHPFRLLVTGSRDWPWDDGGVMDATFDSLRDALGADVPITLVHGHCPTGADAHADRRAHARGWAVERHPADWAALGKKAGFVRNQAMVDAGAHYCIAFIGPCTKHPDQPPHGSHGADHCSSRAEKANIPTARFTHGF